MNVKKFLIAGGNSTALVYDCPTEQRAEMSSQLLSEVEQVGFVATKAKLPELTMMGGDLCINGTIAFASTLGSTGELSTSGLKNPIPYTNEGGTTSIRIPFSYKQEGNIVLLGGIGFILYATKERSEIAKSELVSLSERYSLPAFGGIIYEDNHIIPYVYVAGVDSFVAETACGSGSIAFCIFSGVTEVIQPTGKSISIKKGEFFDISAIVTPMTP